MRAPVRDGRGDSPSNADARVLSRAYCTPDDARQDSALIKVDQELKDHVLDAAFPCVAARSTFNRDNYRFGLLPALGTTAATSALWQGLRAFSDEFEELSQQLVTYIAVFDGAGGESEEQFEERMWGQLQALHVHDARHHAWSSDVSRDPGSNDFSFSVCGRAFFIVGMHPHASRQSRRTPRPTLVFNFHEQFEDLRARGKYEGMKSVIRQRDIALQGSINPVLARFGESSEARQYSGRAVPADWKCPFHALAGERQ